MHEDLEIFDLYFASLVAMTLHPGFTKKETQTPTINDCAAIALTMLEIRNKILCQQSQQPE